jgi:uncharacterized membrane protein
MDQILEKYNDVSAQNSFEEKDSKEYMGLVAICYFFSFLFFVPIVKDSASNYTRFHANQILTLFIAEAIVGVVAKILGFIPILGIILGAAIGLAVLAVVIVLIVGVTRGYAVRLPFIGELIKLF